MQRVFAPKHHLAFVGEVPEECALGQPRSLSDLGHCGPVETLLAVELQRRLL
jgi:hypothetical protein